MSKVVFLNTALVSPGSRSVTFTDKDCSFCCWIVVLPCKRSLLIPGGKTYGIGCLSSFSSIFTTPTSNF